jgi:hypothetical protein
MSAMTIIVTEQRIGARTGPTQVTGIKNSTSQVKSDGGHPVKPFNPM